MSLNITEASAVNKVCDFLLHDIYRDGRGVPTEDEVREALGTLAEAAHGPLMAGWDGTSVGVARFRTRRSPRKAVTT